MTDINVTDTTKPALGLLAIIRAWIKGNGIFMAALRKGEEARAGLPVDDPSFGDYYVWCLELGLSLKPITDQFGAPARALIVAWALAELKRFLDDLARGGKTLLLALVVALWFAGPALAQEVIPAAGETALVSAPAAGLDGVLDQVQAVMAWVVVNQTLVVGFIGALAAIYAGLQRVHRRRNRDALDGFTEAAPAEMVGNVINQLSGPARLKAELSVARTKKVK